MLSQDVCKYVIETRHLFTNYSFHLESCINNRQENIEDTGAMTAWIFQIVKFNIDRIIPRLERLQKNIYIPPVIQEFTYLDIWNSLFGETPKSKVKNSATDDPQLAHIVFKTTDYLLRLSEVLTLQLNEIELSSAFIPTENMLAQKQAIHKLYTHCLRLFSDHQHIIPSPITQSKSWLTRGLRLVFSLVEIKRVAYGYQLTLNYNWDKSEMSKKKDKDTALSVLHSLVQKLDTPYPIYPTTKSTKKILERDNAEDFRVQGRIETPLFEVKKLIENNPNNFNPIDVLHCTRKYKAGL